MGCFSLIFPIFNPEPVCDPHPAGWTNCMSRHCVGGGSCWLCVQLLDKEDTQMRRGHVCRQAEAQPELQTCNDKERADAQ